MVDLGKKTFFSIERECQKWSYQKGIPSNYVSRVNTGYLVGTYVVLLKGR